MEKDNVMKMKIKILFICLDGLLKEIENFKDFLGKME